MARKRVNGRFVRDEAETSPQETASAEWVDDRRQGCNGRMAGRIAAGGVGPRPRDCKLYTRRRFAEALPQLMETLVREATRGSVAHLKLLVQISGLDKGGLAPPKRRREKSLEEILTAEWKKDRELAEADERERALLRANGPAL